VSYTDWENEMEHINNLSRQNAAVASVEPDGTHYYHSALTIKGTNCNTAAVWQSVWSVSMIYLSTQSLCRLRLSIPHFLSLQPSFFAFFCLVSFCKASLMINVNERGENLTIACGWIHRLRGETRTPWRRDRVDKD